jgi:hypothetical protein
MPNGNQQKYPLVSQTVANKFADRMGKRHNGKIDTHLSHQFQKTPAVVHAGVYLDPGMVSTKPLDQRHRDMRCAKAKRKVTGAQMTSAVKSRCNIFQPLDDLMDAGKQVSAICCQLHSRSPAVEKPASHRIFQRPHLLGHGGLAYLQELGRGRKGAVSGHRMEGPQLRKVHSSLVVI